MQKVGLSARLTEIETEEDFLGSLEELEEVFPGLRELDGCEQQPSVHAEGDALVHTAKVFANAKTLAAKLPERERLLLLAAAAAHDIEKPATRAVEGEKITFYRHAERAAERCPEFARNLGLTPEEADSLRWLVRHHMDVHVMADWGEKKRLAIYRHPAFPILVDLQEADARASWKTADGREHAPVLREFLLQDSQELLERAARTERLANLRKQVTKALLDAGHRPGKPLGDAVKSAVEWAKAQPDERWDEAEAYALRLLQGEASQ